MIYVIGILYLLVTINSVYSLKKDLQYNWVQSLVLGSLMFIPTIFVFASMFLTFSTNIVQFILKLVGDGWFSFVCVLAGTSKDDVTFRHTLKELEKAIKKQDR